MRGLATALAAAVAVLLAGCGGATSEAPAAFSATALRTERAVSLADLRGRPALLTSWATWCLECRDELPRLEAYWRARRADGLQVVAVNVDVTGSRGRAVGMAERFGLSMPLWRDEDDAFTATFDGLGVPMTVLLDREGRVASVWQGVVDFTGREVSGAVDAALATGGAGT